MGSPVWYCALLTHKRCIHRVAVTFGIGETSLTVFDGPIDCKRCEVYNPEINTKLTHRPCDKNTNPDENTLLAKYGRGLTNKQKIIIVGIP